MNKGFEYIVRIEPDQFSDPQRKWPDGHAWTSYIYNIDGEVIDGQGDIETFKEAKDLLVSTLSRLLQ